MVDYGDAPTVPGYHLETLERIEAHLRPVHEAGVTPLCLGGDHSMVLAELRAAAATHGPLALIHLDAHADVWDAYFGMPHFHGTVFKRGSLSLGLRIGIVLEWLACGSSRLPRSSAVSIAS